MKNETTGGLEEFFTLDVVYTEIYPIYDGTCFQSFKLRKKPTIKNIFFKT